MARCTKEEAQETRERILDAAEDVFHAKGVSQTSLHDVAEAAGVTRGAIYWHFKNKSDLFEAMFERIHLPMETMVQASVVETETDPLGQLRAVCLFVLRDSLRNPHARKVLDIIFHRCEWVDANGSIAVRQRAAFERGTANIERLLANAVKRQQLPPDLDTRLAAVTFHAIIDGLLNNWLFSPDGFALDEMAEQQIDAALEMLRCAPSMRRNGPCGGQLEAQAKAASG